MVAASSEAESEGEELVPYGELGIGDYFGETSFMRVPQVRRPQTLEASRTARGMTRATARWKG